MTQFICKETEFEQRMFLPNGIEALIERKNGRKLVIHTTYQGVYGLGEKFDALNQRGKKVSNQVIEKFCNQGSYSYCVTPFFITNTGLGVYIDTKKKTVFDFQNEITCEIPSEASVYLFNGTVKEILKEYMQLFGKVPMIPDYAFGIWISANYWNSQKDVEFQLKALKQYKFPASVMVLEAWSDEATFYIWNGAKYNPKKTGEGFLLEHFDYSESKYFNDPVKMIEEIHEQGLKLVLWQIPVFKKQSNEEEPCKQLQLDKEYALENNLCVVNHDNTPYEIPDGNWFDGSYIPDFTREKTKEFWFNKRRYLLDMGVDGFKTDGGEFIYAQDVKFADGTTGLEGKNQYCQDYLNAYTEFITDKNVLFSRAGYAGAHITPIHWAGDHQSTNQELKNALIAGLTAAMSGITFWSFDIGGFAGPLPTLDLYRRSTQFACFCPIMQWHSEPSGGQFKDLMPGGEGNNERSPWNMVAYYQTPEFVDEMRYWHKLRASLLPFIMDIAKQSTDTYQPMMRPLIYEYPEQIEFCDSYDEYMFGSNMLVAPLLEENQTIREVCLPKGKWFGFFSGEEYMGGRKITSEKEKMPVFVKDGTTILFEMDGKIKCRIFGSNGKQQLFFHNQYIQISWKDKEVLVEGTKETIEVCDV